MWKKDLIRERMAIESKRGFGKGIVIDRMKKEEQHIKTDHAIKATTSEPTNEALVYIYNHI